MSRVLVLQHVGPETPGTIANALDVFGVTAEYARIFEGQPVPPELGNQAGLIVLGGPMGVYDYARYPFLRDEMRLIEQALRLERPVLGVCLGSQLLAATLGSNVRKGSRKEIGWYEITLTEAATSDPLWTGTESSFVAYHWHGDVFDLPHGAVSLASSTLTECQAFRYGRNAYGFLFHMEVTEDIIGDMVRTFSDELRDVNVDGQNLVAQSRRYLPSLKKVGSRVFSRWVGLL